MEPAAISIALNLVVKTATTAITNEIGLLLGVQEEMFFIKEELDMMQAFLEASSTEKTKGVVVDRWIKQVQELAFDVEDCLHEASVHMMKKSCLPFMCSVKKRDDIARKIRVLKTRIEDVSKRNQRYNLINKENGGYPNESASSISMANVPLLVGLDEPKRKLVELITKENGEAISVVGMGGLGKTTLVREVYGCQELRTKFEHFAWVTVLHPFNPEKFIESLAKQILANPGTNKSKVLPKKTTKEQVIEYLRDKKYLIVLDDLWHVLEWAEINDVLPKGNKRRIIITTRLRPLAESISDTSDNIYVINKLSEKDALDLFYKAVYKTPNYNLVIDDRESKDDLPAENKCKMGEGSSSTEIMKEENETQKQCTPKTGEGSSSTQIMKEENETQKQCIPKTGEGSSSTEIMKEENETQKQCTPKTGEGSSSTEIMKEENETQKQCTPKTGEGSSSTEIMKEENETQKQCTPKTGEGSSSTEIMKEENETQKQCTPKTGEDSSSTEIMKEENETQKQCTPKTGEGSSSTEIMKEENETQKQCTPIRITKEMITQSNLIINSCGQLPLAIVTIGSYLATKPKTSVEWKTMHDHLSTELDRNPDLGLVKNVLTSSYDGLPYHLKPSLLYLSVFHNSKEIRRSRIIRRWMADGYVTEGRKKTATEVGKDYFNDLMGRSLIQPSQTSTIVNRDIKRCNVHDIMYELILAKAMHENMVSLFEDENLITMTDRVRHLVITGGSCTGDKVQERMQLSHLRSLSIFGKVGDYVSYPRMKLLRVLDLEGTLGLNNGDLKSVCKLRLLRYLGLRGTNITKLPDSLGKLSELETLDIKNTRVVRLPTGLTKLHKLSYLRAGKFIYGGVRAPRGIGALRSLNILGEIDIGRSKGLAKEMQNLTNLSKLDVSGFVENNAAALAKVIDRQKHLRSLVLTTKYELANVIGRHSPELSRCLDSVESPPMYLQSLKLYGPLFKLPGWISSLEYLQKIHFYDTGLKEIQAIEKLPNLKILYMLYDLTGEMKKLSFGVGTFPMLQVMILQSLVGLKSVSIQNTALKRLEKLKITGCEGIIRQDGVSGLEFLEQLKEIEVKVFAHGRDTLFESNVQEQLNKLPQKPVLRVVEY